MYKLIAVLAIVGLTACGSSAASDSATTTDSTTTGGAAPIVTIDTTHADSSVTAPTVGENVK